MSAINIGMETVSCAVLLVLVLMQMSKANKTWQDRLFVLVLAICLFQTACEAAAWMLGGVPGTAARTAALIINFLNNSTVTFSMFFFLFYIVVYITPNEKLSPAQKRPLWVVGALSVAQFILCVVNIWNGMLYYIDANNHYHWGEYYLTQYVITWIQLMIVMLSILAWRKTLSKKDTWAFMSFVALPCLASLVTFFDTNFMLHYPAVMLSLLLIYTTVQKDQEKRLELALLRSRADIMVSQIQPHFLYNTLASIQDLCRDNPEAKKAVLTFSRYLRSNMESLTKREPIPFAQELEHTKHYLWLEQLRFEERLTVVYDIQATAFKLPALSLQPIVENAVLHGITAKTEGGTVWIRTEQDAHAHRIIVKDDGLGFSPEAPPDAEPEGETSHIGIQNVRQRLGVLCGGNLSIDSAPGRGTVAVITIPRQEVVRNDDHRC